jgi:hypothetical protein
MGASIKIVCGFVVDLPGPYWPSIQVPARAQAAVAGTPFPGDPSRRAPPAGPWPASSCFGPQQDLAIELFVYVCVMDLPGPIAPNSGSCPHPPRAPAVAGTRSQPGRPAPGLFQRNVYRQQLEIFGDSGALEAFMTPVRKFA